MAPSLYFQIKLKYIFLGQWKCWQTAKRVNVCNTRPKVLYPYILAMLLTTLECATLFAKMNNTELYNRHETENTEGGVMAL